ncbi:MAG: hypothetical protein KDA43_15155 [Hyphomonas sp.]|nr:hypothetical protein [Hyphomonas sp.]
MAIAASPAQFAEVMDPQEVLEWTIPCAPILELGEQIDTFDVALYAEATALGLTVLGTGDGYPDPALSNNNQDIVLWTKIDDAYQGNAAFDGAGTALPANVHIVTNAAYPRERNRDIQWQVSQRGQ